MPRFYFHLSDGRPFTDDEGYELENLAAARVSAVQLVAQLMRDSPEAFWANPEWILTVTDDQELTLFTLQVVATDAPSLRITAVPNGAPTV